MSKRMVKDARREQLLSIAVSIIKNRGSEALTLATVAQEAGVTKPVAYNHFETKEKLLKQIYQNIDNRLIESIQLAKQSSCQSTEDIISILCDSYVDCMQINGEIYDLTVAALKCYPNNIELSQDIQDFFVEAYADIFQISIDGDNHINRLKLISINGVIESIGESVISEQVPRHIAMPYLKSRVYNILVD